MAGKTKKPFPWVKRREQPARPPWRPGLADAAILAAILAIIASPLFVRWSRGRQGSLDCADNLKAIGMAVRAYAADWGGWLPYAVDPGDISAANYDPYFRSQRAEMLVAPRLNLVLLPYLTSPETFHCPLDRGFDYFHGTEQPVPAHARPTCFAAWGTSYNYHSQLSFDGVSYNQVAARDDINLAFDAHGSFHAVGTGPVRSFRYNVLYTDGHVKNVSRSEYADGWRSPMGYRGGYRAAD